jgi:outer membrane protein OmpA-like peptidoglycan-associated protein
MLRRGALVLFLFVASGIAALLAANHAGITWPWQREQAAEAPQATPSAEQAKDAASQQSASKEPAAASPENARKAIEETTVALAPNANPSEPKPGSVAIDISKISPDGASVFAGRAEPNKYVTVLENGKPAATVQADANGDWSVSTEHKFASTDPKLTYDLSDAPPPAPVAPAPEPKVAAAAPAAPAKSATGDVMKKFEDMVAAAREEAKQEEAKKAEDAKKEQEEKLAAARPADPPKPEVPTVGAASGAATAVQKPVEENVAEQKSAEQGKPETGTGQQASTSSSASEAGGSSSGQTSSASVDPGASQRAAQQAKAEPSAPIPVPIMFVYNEATLTADGERAARLLLEYLTLKRYSAIELTGHADERGTYEYNMDLSRDRLTTVASLLKSGGYHGDLSLIPKGKSAPYAGVDRKQYTGEALFQLDRRVELRVAR